ncbi:MAG: hypothetical protein ABI927_03265 [Gaiellaceae bacterium]
MAFPLRHYLPGNVPVQAIPLSTRSTTEIAFIRASPASGSARTSALWVVTTYLSSHDPTGVVLSSLGRHATLTNRWRLGGDFELRRYVARSTIVRTHVCDIPQSSRGRTGRTAAAAVLR